ncbi:hypothetical protein PsorP6_001312 [Peronosclerospora sorghi]|uniref:Uncharacterized protein n=1 Tax=Peronosclerospora sorghi TaxID=230839 RepID=A0ACC0WVC1_9STRA|nr:hypothetical protein PsorP6_001312 [Peronosclerospora sorghi]
MLEKCDRCIANLQMDTRKASRRINEKALEYLQTSDWNLLISFKANGEATTALQGRWAGVSMREGIRGRVENDVHTTGKNPDGRLSKSLLITLDQKYNDDNRGSSAVHLFY